ncbi:hypothetical protein ACUXAV_002885 [Cupriavidus metallidurans]|nr:hypothetical protein AU374_04825 [Cupriavidus metallidurans]
MHIAGYAGFPFGYQADPLLAGRPRPYQPACRLVRGRLPFFEVTNSERCAGRQVPLLYSTGIGQPKRGCRHT